MPGYAPDERTDHLVVISSRGGGVRAPSTNSAKRAFEHPDELRGGERGRPAPEAATSVAGAVLTDESANRCMAHPAMLVPRSVRPSNATHGPEMSHCGSAAAS